MLKEDPPGAKQAINNHREETEPKADFFLSESQRKTESGRPGQSPAFTIAVRETYERTLVELFDLDPGSIGIGTNCEGLVSIEVQIWSSEPAVVTEYWDHIIECGIEVPSGVLVVVACCGHPEDFFEVPLGAGKYTVRVCYGNQYECGDEDPTCTGEYLIMLWPSQDNVARVIKSHVDFFASTVS